MKFNNLYNSILKEPIYDNFPFWDAFKAVKNGEWTEEDFQIWASSVWNDGGNVANEQRDLLAND